MPAAEETFDFVVVGGGSAGCVIATRLSEDPDVSVLLLEAGGDERRRAIERPEEWATLLGSEFDWGYRTTVQESTGHPYTAHRGKVLGGSGSINNMAHLRGHRQDFDEWARNGAEGWDHAGVLPYFKRSEDVPDGDPRYRGGGGPLHPRPLPPHPFARAFVAGAAAIGHPVVDDLNAAEMLGAGYYDMLIRDGLRESTATAYLRPAIGRANLAVRTSSLARRLLLRASRCVGVEYLRDGEVLRARAAAEVVVCAGAIDSPCLLMRSGVGPAGELARLGVEPAVDAPQVGRNLQDHLLLAGLRYAPERPVEDPEGYGDGTVFLKTDGGEHGPDLHLFTTEGDYHMPWQQPCENSFTICVGLMRPRSRGTVRPATADPKASPIIDLGYLTAEGELEQLITGIEAVDGILTANELGEWQAGTSEFRRLLEGDRGALEHAVREAAGSYFHYSGTCRMGSDAEAVVDPELRVNGIDGLRVADASVMPTIVSANTNAATVMIGEKASDLLRSRAFPDADRG